MMEGSGCGESPQPDDDDEIDCKTAALDIKESMEKSKEFWGDHPPDQSIIPATLLKCPPCVDDESKVSYASELAHLAWVSMEQNDFEDIAKINKDLLSNGEIPVNNLIEPINKILNKMGDEFKIKQELQKIDDDYRQAIILVANQLLYIFGENEPPSIAEEEADVSSHIKAKVTKEPTLRRSGTTESHKAIKNRIKLLVEAAIEQGLGEIKLPKGIYVNDRAKLTLLERQIRGRLRLKNIIENCSSNSQTNTNKSSDISSHRNTLISRKYDLSKRLKPVKAIRDKILTQNVTIGDQKSSEKKLHKESSTLSTNVTYNSSGYAEELATTSFSESGIKTKSMKSCYDDSVTMPTGLPTSSPLEKQQLEIEISPEASVMNIQDKQGTSSSVKLHKCSRQNLKLRIKHEDANSELDDFKEYSAKLNQTINKKDLVTDNFSELQNSYMDPDMEEFKAKGCSLINISSDLEDLNEPCCSRDEKFDDNLREDIMKEQNESETSSKENDHCEISQIHLSSNFSQAEKCRIQGSSGCETNEDVETDYDEFSNVKTTSSSGSSSFTVNSETFLCGIKDNIIESAVGKGNADETLSSSSELQLNQTALEKKSKMSFKNILPIRERNDKQLSKLNLISEKKSSSDVKIEVKQETGYTEKPGETYPFKNEMKIIANRKDLSLVLRDSMSEVRAKTALLFEQTYNVQPVVKIEQTEIISSLDDNSDCNNNLNISVQALNEIKELKTESSPFSISSEESKSTTKITTIECEDNCGDTDLENAVISENIGKLSENFEGVDSEIKENVSQNNFVGLESDSNNQAFDVGTFSVNELDNSTDVEVNMDVSKKPMTNHEYLKVLNEYMKEINEDNDEDIDRELDKMLIEEDKVRNEKENVSEEEDDEESEEEDDDDDDDDEEEEDDEDDESAEVEDDADETDEDEDDDENEETSVDDEERSSEISEKSLPRVTVTTETSEKIINDEIDDVDSKGKKRTGGDNTLLYVTIFLGVFTATYFSDYARQFFSNVIISNMKSNTVHCLDKAINVMTTLKLKLQER
ncbi:hypothetical protein O3M35_006771 [Rhynocoris fuscipes]|uniref:Uncharacterized protein n=1 Tax=Rhynocoris fuscipes TaxID=488301 RepID=A0AAW1DKL7_9HEMI